MLFIHILISLLPVIAFLGGLILIDSYKLLSPKMIGLALGVGLVAALASLGVNSGILMVTGWSRQVMTGFSAPVVEEILKGVFIVYLVMSNRVGFAVDAAIMGFAIGAGFAVVENVFYLGSIPDAATPVWIMRGFGTAIMHGLATTLFAVTVRTLHRSDDQSLWWPVTAGLIPAILVHSAYNLFLLPPLITIAVLLVVGPLLIFLVFTQSERKTREWLGAGFDTDQELLTLIMKGTLPDSRVGQYLQALRSRFEGPVVVDMLCLIRLRVELSLRAKGILMMRSSGFSVPADPAMKARFDEMRHLEQSIGRTGLLALEPIHKLSRKELWQLNMLESTA